MTTVLETIEGGTRYLAKRGIEDARRNMQLLVAHHLGCSRMDLYLQFDRPLEESILAPLRTALRRRGEGVPLQHILGSVAFLHHEFLCDSRGLIPRPETEELAEWILSWQLPETQRVADVGCGSGVLGLSLAAAKPSWQLTLTDVSPDALSLARENAAKLGLDAVEFHHGDLLETIPGPFDGIAANLPYVPITERPTLSAEVLHDPALALFGGTDGLDIIRRFIPQAFTKLAPGGWLVMEIGHNQATLVTELLTAAGFTAVEVKTDLSGVARFPFAKRP